MSSLAIPWMLHAAPMGFQKTAPIQQKARYAFIELVRPDCYSIYSIEQRFQIWRWMVRTAMNIKPTDAETGRWGVHGPIELLSGQPTCCGMSEVAPIRSIKDLNNRFHWALLSRDAGPSARRWRGENYINVDARRILYFPHYAPFCGAPLQGKPTAESDVRKALDILLDATGTLTTQLNSCHAGAVEIYGVSVAVRPEGFRFVLRYGFDGSSWDHELAATPNMWEGTGDTFHRNPYGRKSEPFINTLDRAITTLESLTVLKDQNIRPADTEETIETKPESRT